MNLYKFLKKVFYSFNEKISIGVRILLIHDNKILLVKHTYQSGWYSIGGGVDKGESPLEAIQRELKEETGVTLKTAPKLFAVYHNDKEKRDDYVVLYIGHDYTQEESWSPEILDKKWFPLDNLPDDATPATKRRIAEYLGQAKISDRW